MLDGLSFPAEESKSSLAEPSAPDIVHSIAETRWQFHTLRSNFVNDNSSLVSSQKRSTKLRNDSLALDAYTLAGLVAQIDSHTSLIRTASQSTA
jgi:hypothetical protein